ncbi:MAG: class I SAM-dependent methyltransferase [Thermodesulfobacteriota bacterium]
MSPDKSSKKEAFSKKMTDILNFGALNLAMAIGYKTRLFDVMDTFDNPQPVKGIAHAAKLDPRYVKEWLGIMAAGDVVELTSGRDGEDLFFLPEAHGDLITRRAGNSNIGVYTQEIPLLTACAMKPVLQGFQTGEGITYDHYPEFQAFMTELADAKHRQVLVDTFLPSVKDGDLVARLRKGIRVCDLGCGEGLAPILMAEAFPKSEFVGFDISEEALSIARNAAADRNLPNVSFLNRDAAKLMEDETTQAGFDYVTAFDAIHDQNRPLEALKGVHHILKPGGWFSMIDIAAGTDLADNMDHPMGPFLYTVSLMHCMPVGRVDGGPGLGMMWGREKAMEMLNTAGFSEVEVLEIPDDPFNFHYFCRK